MEPMQPVAGLEPEKQVYAGLCVGGPLDGEQTFSRYPKGCNRLTDTACIYDWDGESFNVRDADGMPLENDPAANDNRWRAAEESDYDVIAWTGEEA
jgi:hypothetical protein